MSQERTQRPALLLMSLTLAAMSFSLLDLAMKTSWFQRADAGPALLLHAWSMASGLSILFGGVMWLGLALLGVAIASRRTEGLADDYGLPGLYDLIFGPQGQRVLPLPGWIALAYAIGHGSYLVFYGYAMERFQSPYVVALSFSTTLAIALSLALYRVAVWRRPSWALRRGLLLTTLAVVFLYFADLVLFELKPDYRWLFALTALLGFVIASTGLIVEYQPHHRKRMRGASYGLSLFPALGVIGLLSWYNADPILHSYLTTHTRMYPALLTATQPFSDTDGDGHASAFGFGDCDDSDPDIHPEAMEVPGNDVDENCQGGALPALPPSKLLGADPRRTATTRPPDIIFITVDALRHDMPPYQHDGKPLMPATQRLAGESVNFEHAYAPSTHTTESMIGLMTGRYPTTWWQAGLRFGARQSLPLLLQELGYETRAVSTTFMMHPDINAGYDNTNADVAKVTKQGNVATSQGTTLHALQQLRERDPSKPIFLWVHYFDPHAAYIFREAYEEWLGTETPWKLYLHEVHDTDRAIGELLEPLRKSPGWDNTIVVLTGDHGDAFGEHNNRGHLWSNYEEVIRVPLLMKLPSIPAQTRKTPTPLLAVYPTLMDHIGVTDYIPRPEPSLLPYLKTQTDPPARPIFVEAGYPIPLFFVAIDQGWKLAHDRRYNSYALYDLTSDPKERNNLVSQKPAQFERMRALMGQWRDRTYNTTKYERLAELYQKLDAKKKQ